MLDSRAFFLYNNMVIVKQITLQGFRLFLWQKCSKIKVFNNMNRVLNNLIVENQRKKSKK